MALIRSTMRPDLFSEMDNEDAWLLGLIWADGCLSEHQRKRGGKRIVVGSTDEELANHICRIARVSATCRVDPRPNRKPMFSMRLGHPEVVRRAELLGLHARKTLTCTFPYLPWNVTPAFVRGYFDGDGSVGLYRNPSVVDPEWPPRLVSGFIGSPPFIARLQEVLEATAGIAPKKPNVRRGSVVATQYNHGDSLRLAKFMYAQDGPCLTRKRRLFERGAHQRVLRSRAVSL